MSIDWSLLFIGNVPTLFVFALFTLSGKLSKKEIINMENTVARAIILMVGTTLVGRPGCRDVSNFGGEGSAQNCGC